MTSITYSQRPFDPAVASQFLINNEPRAPTMLLLDTSGSMAGPAIAQVNRGLALLHNGISADALALKRVELAAVTFGGSVQKIQDFATLDQFSFPVLSANGGTPMGEALTLGLDLIEARQRVYASARQRAYKPNIILMSDGQPTDSIQGPAARLAQLVNSQRAYFLPVGVDGADMSLLSSLTSTPPINISAGRIAALMKYVSESLRTGSQKSIAAQTGIAPPNSADL